MLDNEKNAVENEDDLLEKSLTAALTKLEKASKKPPVDEDEEYEEEDEGEEEIEDDDDDNTPPPPKSRKGGMRKSTRNYDFEILGKSLPEIISEDEDSSEVVDAMPFVKSLMDGIDEQIFALSKAVLEIGEKIESMERKMNKSIDVEVAQAKLVKSIASDIKTFGETANPVKSVLGKSINIMRKTEEGKEVKTELSKSDALDKLTELHKAGKIGINQVAIYEGRIQKGINLPEDIQKMLLS